MEKERQQWLDAVKGMAIILVVMGHIGSTYGGDSVSRSFTVFHQFIYSFHMPLFMCISGYLFRTSLYRKDLKATALSKLLAYGIPYLVFSAVYWLMKTLGGAFVNHTVSFRDLLLISVFPLSFMWYLYALLLMTELSLFLGRKDPKIVLIVAAVCRILWEILTLREGFTNSWANDLVLTDFIKNYIWFAIGLVYMEHITEFFSSVRNTIKYLFMAGGFLILFTAALMGLTKVQFLRMIWGAVGITTLVLAGLLIHQNRMLEYLGRNTIQIYLFHGTVISVLKIISDKLHLPMWGGWFPMIYGTVIAILIPLAVYGVCKKVPALDFLFFPSRYIKFSSGRDE